MLWVHFSYRNVQTVLYALTDLKHKTNSPKVIEEVSDVRDKFDVAIEKAGGVVKYHERGQVEEQREWENKRIKELVGIYQNLVW